ncbi:HAD family phosphatase [Acidisphaera sp. S103]|uniref:HAD family hydrolase n=1 Tax=Acidisphaera sp. S103 TaxID=1747223 RepID=UPI00131C109D|nr:HAD family phosphatase [Acidisphaera sp. S103]
MSSQRLPGLVIFDCDGVLIDSQVIQCRIDAAELTRLGFQVSAEELAQQFIGTATKDIQAHVEAALGRPLPDDFEATRDRLVDAAYQTELQAVAGVADVLSRIGLPVCVASNAQLARLREILEVTGLLSFFGPNVFGADLVPRPKPAPDLFLHAAARLGASASRCVVIEDSEAGIQAAKAAGMRVLGFYGGGHCYPGYERRLTAAGASAVFRSMGELLPLLGIAD